MEETDIKILRLKCNTLIDKALQMEKEIQDKNLVIKELQEQKNILEQQIKLNAEESVDVLQPNEAEEASVSKILVSCSELSSENFKDIYGKITEIMKQVNAEMDAYPQELKKTTGTKGARKKKILKVFTNSVEKILKVVGIGILMLLVSLAITVLLNETLRNTLLEFIKSCIG